MGDQIESDGDLKVEHSSLRDEKARQEEIVQTKLHRALQARHITMIAIGGAIGNIPDHGVRSILAKVRRYRSNHWYWANFSQGWVI